MRTKMVLTNFDNNGLFLHPLLVRLACELSSELLLPQRVTVNCLLSSVNYLRGMLQCPIYCSVVN